MRKAIKFSSILIILITILYITCKKKDITSVTIVTTSDITNITLNSAVSGGEVINDGGIKVTERGVCWAMRPTPKLTDNKTSDGVDTGKFISTITNLLVETKYYVRAYAVNSNGAGYGDELSFTTATPNITKVTISLKNSSVLMGGESSASAVVLNQFNSVIPGVNVNWSSTDQSIASIDQNGKITTEYDGDVYIRAKIGNVADSVKFSVTPDYSNWKAFFKPVANAFPDLNSYFNQTGGSSLLTVLARLDMNKDGKTDLVFHLWHFRSPADNLTMGLDDPVANRLVALVSQKNGTLIDQTIQLFGSSIVDLAGDASRKVRIADLNNDGYPDWVYALNREDYRPNTGTSGANKTVAVLSNGNGTYGTIAFGDINYHHSVEILPLYDGGFHVLLDGDEEYSFSNGDFIKNVTCPSRAIGTYIAFSYIQNNPPDYLLTDKSESSYLNPNYLALYKRNGNNAWELESVFKWPSFRQVVYIAYNGDVGTNNVISYRGKEYVAGGFFESVSLRLYPNSPPVPIIHFGTSYITGGTAGLSTIYQNNTCSWSKLMAFQSQNGLLEEIDIISDPEGPFNINFMDARDINKDGYDDLITYPYIDGAKPRVYLNNHSGQLILINASKLPLVAVGGNYNSAFADVDGDGIDDLVFFPGNGCSSNNTCTTFLLYKGRRNLE